MAGLELFEISENRIERSFPKSLTAVAYILHTFRMSLSIPIPQALAGLGFIDCNKNIMKRDIS